MILDFNKKLERPSTKTALSLFFLECLFVNCFVTFVLLVFCVLVIWYWPRLYYTWTFLLRIGFVVEWILTLICCTQNIDPLKIFGPNRSLITCIRYLSYYKTLGWRTLICLIDLFLLNPILVLLHIILFAVESNVVSYQFLFYILLDLLFIAEPFFALWSVYSIGVIHNIKRFI